MRNIKMVQKLFTMYYGFRPLRKMEVQEVVDEEADEVVDEVEEVLDDEVLEIRNKV